MSSSDVPPDFVPLSRTSPFIDTVGPLFQRRQGTGMSIGFHVAVKHTNTRGQLHGGVIATVGDISLGYALVTLSDPPIWVVTASLNVDFVGSGSVGDWIESRVDIQKIGSRLAFASAYFHLGEVRIAHVSGVFAVVDPVRR